MSFRNTTSSQDNDIRRAEESNHIQNLIEIIQSLDEQISEWKSAAGEWSCETPDGLRSLRTQIDQQPESGTK